MTRFFRTSLLICTIGLLIAARVASAQELRGTVRDSTSSQAIPGVVLMLLDANGAVVGRNITNERGEFRVALTTGMQRVRFVRIGFRPREAPIPTTENGIATLDPKMRSLPTMLEPIRVSAGAHCPKRKDSDVAFALLEQARTGLLATVVAREANPGTLVRLGFDRAMDDDRIMSQKVRADSALATAKSFASVHDAAEFVSRGFMADSGGEQTFFGPDADVLLDQSFTDGYCFRIADNNRDRAAQIGLSFAPAQRRRDRIDIEGTLWIDTVARALRDVEYRYVGLDPRLNSVRPGGRIWFREMPNGVVLIDRWSIRLPTAENETVFVGSREEQRQWFRPVESGGELARASWPGGFTWRASLGRMQGEAKTEGGRPAAGAAIHLPGTHYYAVVDSLGHFEFSDLLPGPYKFAVVDMGLAEMGIEIPIADSIVAVRDSVVHRSLVLRTPRDYVADKCVADGKFSPGNEPFVFGRVTAFNGGSVAGLTVTLRDNTPGSDGRQIPGVAKLGTDGTFQWCQYLSRGKAIMAEVFQRGAKIGWATQVLEAGVVLFPITVTLRNP